MKDIPADFKLPPPLLKSTRRGPLRERFEVSLETVTPILGGGPHPREVDKVDIVRAATIRGHLRFWWRALNTHMHDFAKSEDLYAEEARIWGHAGDGNGGRSPIELRVLVKHEDITKVDRDNPKNQEAYALWPARGTRRETTAERREPGLKFRLSVAAPKNDLDRVRDALRLWILFGGYGSRTRRGLGALKVTGAVEEWLPKGADNLTLRKTLNDLFSCSRDLFTGPAHPLMEPTPVPVLAGASLLVKFLPQNQKNDARLSWHTALHSLRDFRQGAPVARVAEQGYSRWPEADSVRSINSGVGHPIAPKHTNGGPRWPRAGFGLPIGIRFNRDKYPGDPEDVQLNSKHFNRLAGPLIVKPLPVQGGFIPMALWLNRADPENVQVVARRGMTELPRSAAPLGKFDAPSFDPAKGKSTLREAFLDWLKAPQQGWVEI